MSDAEGLGDDFHRLVKKLSLVLEPCSGQSFYDVDPQVIVEAMQQYTSNPSDWEKYAWGADNRGYTRNLVHKGNGKSNLLILVWSPGKGSPIHDHASSHCVMKVLQGSLCETRVGWPDEGVIKTGAASPPKVQKTSTYEENETTYMSDELGLHKISNPDPERRAVSLHLYTPPNAAQYGCYIFDEKTGRRSHTSQSHFYSEYGKLVEKTKAGAGQTP